MWGDRVITDRMPYEISGELIMAGNQSAIQFPDNTFSNNTDKPFEIHRMKPFVWGLGASDVLLQVQPDQDALAGAVRLYINDLGLNQIITKNPTLIPLMTKGSSERTWEFADPHYLTRGNQIQVIATTLALTNFSTITNVRIGLGFQGFLLVVAPPTENR